MTLIDGDKIITAQLYDDEHEEYTEKKMSIIDFVNAFTDEGVTTADDVLDKIRAELTEKRDILVKEARANAINPLSCYGLDYALLIIDKYRGEIEE